VIARFRNVLRSMAPAWLREGEGGQVLFSLGYLMDGFVERLREGVHARFPSDAPADALAYLGRDRRIRRGLSESDASYRVRLIRYLDDLRVLGNPYALMTQLRAFLGADLAMRTVDNNGTWFSIEADGTRSVELGAGNWDWDGSAASWSRFWVIIYPNGFWSTITWGDPALTWGKPDLTWGSTATPDQVKGVRELVAEWKPAGTRCVNIIIAFDNASFDPTDPPGAPLPDGTWGKMSKNDVGEQVPSRLASARYWKGTS